MNTCIAIIVIFSDAVWHQPALQLATELAAPDVCILHYLWSNSSCTYCWHQEPIPLNEDESSTWGARQYFARIRQRVPIMSRLMQSLPLDNGKWVGMFDADIVSHRNVTGRITQRFANEQPPPVMVVQQEWPCKMHPFRLCVNGGLWAVRRSLEGVQLLARTEQLMRQLHIPDQDALDIVASGRAVHYLDRHLFANGYTMLHESVERAHLVHVNWQRSTACKLEWLKKLRETRFHLDADYTALRSSCQ